MACAAVTAVFSRLNISLIIEPIEMSLAVAIYRHGKMFDRYIFTFDFYQGHMIKTIFFLYFLFTRFSQNVRHINQHSIWQTFPHIKSMGWSDFQNVEYLFYLFLDVPVRNVLTGNTETIAWDSKNQVCPFPPAALKGKLEGSLIPSYLSLTIL